MVYYSTATFQPFLAALADAMHAPVEAFDYLKAPEHTVEESVELLAEHIAARCETLADRQLVLAGDSVGALLSLYLSLRVLPGAFSRIVLIYPVLDLHTERESYQTFGEGYFLDRGRHAAVQVDPEPVLRDPRLRSVRSCPSTSWPGCRRARS